MKAIYPGTFDPITNGHIDIAKRAVSFLDELIVAVAKKPSKNCFFSYPERLGLVQEALSSISKIKVLGFEGLVVDFARIQKSNAIIRGLRTMSDFEYEFKMALTNKNLSPEIETLFLMTHPQYSFMSSQLIKEIAFLGGDLANFLPPEVLKAVNQKRNEG